MKKIWNNNTPIELGVTDPGELGFALSIVIATVKEYNGISGMYEIIEDMNGFVQSKVENTNMSSLMLLNLCDKYNIDVRLPLSQGLIESHYGTKGLAFKTNSIFNMGAYDGWKYDKILGIYKYTHPNMSIEPYLKSLSNNYLTEGKTEADLLKNFVNSNGSRYASYKGYESELRLTWGEINSTTRLDSLLQEYNYYKLELNR